MWTWSSKFQVLLSVVLNLQVIMREWVSILYLYIIIKAYVTEMSDTKWRTTFNSGIGLSCLFGTVFTYILGAVFHWRTIIYISCIYPFCSFFIAIVVPESPPWLITKGKL